MSPNTHLHVTDRVAIVTGGGTGIGRATALHACDARLHGRDLWTPREPLEAVREQMVMAGGVCLAEPCDIREPEQVERISSPEYSTRVAGSTHSSTMLAVSSR